MKTVGLHGKITSPNFGKNHIIIGFPKTINRTYKLEFPRDLRNNVGSGGFLVIHLWVNISQHGEILVLNQGEKYFQPISKVAHGFQEAEEVCLRKGGHLTSILSTEEMLKLNERVGHHTKQYCIGAKKQNGSWTWSDGSPWRGDNSSFVYFTDGEGDCLYYIQTTIRTLKSCELVCRPLCKLGQRMFQGQENVTLIYTEEDLSVGMTDITVSHQLTTMASEGDFSLEWFIEGAVDYELRTNQLRGKVSGPGPNRLRKGTRYKYLFSFESLSTHQWNGSLTINITRGIQSDLEVVGYDLLDKKYIFFHSDQTVEFVSDEQYWNVAEEYCSIIGGHLPSVHSMEDLTAIAQASGYYDGIWLGGFLTPSGHWAWSDGTPWDFDNWDETNVTVEIFLSKSDKPFLAIGSWPKNRPLALERRRC